MKSFFRRPDVTESLTDKQQETGDQVKMKDNSLPRILLISFCAAVYIAVLVVNALAGAGRGELKVDCSVLNPYVTGSFRFFVT